MNKSNSIIEVIVMHQWKAASIVNLEVSILSSGPVSRAQVQEARPGVP